MKIKAKGIRPSWSLILGEQKNVKKKRGEEKKWKKKKKRKGMDGYDFVWKLWFYMDISLSHC